MKRFDPSAFCDRLDRISDKIGHAVAWLIPAMAVVMFLVVILRYAFDVGAVAFQESVAYFHAAVIALCAAYTLRRNAHMRVDIFYRHFSARTRAAINVGGCLLFLIPVCVLLLVISPSYAARSWRILESSPEAGGIPLVFVLKTLIPVMAALLLAQAVSGLLRNIVYMMRTPRPQ